VRPKVGNKKKRKKKRKGGASNLDQFGGTLDVAHGAPDVEK
jgi:hypothetical protein